MSKAFVVAGTLLILLVAAMGSTALAQQDYDLEAPLEGFPEDETFSARTVGDYIVVADDDYCRILIGATFGQTARYLPEEMVGKDRKAQRARLTRFAAPGDSNTAVCADVLHDLGATILPESLARLLTSGSEDGPLAPSGEGLTIEARGAGTTDYFRLEGGLYLAMIDSTGCDTWEGMLMHGRGEPALAAALTESNLLEDIELGLYYWSIQAPDCDWSVTILPEEQE